ncbi:type III pantothenate kinase [Verrucomicrobiota bacterium]
MKQDRGNGCLAVDIGNTNVCLGLVRGGKVVRRRRLRTHLRARGAVREAIRAVLRTTAVRGSVLGSVVPSEDPVWVSELARALGEEPVRISHKLALPISISYPRPSAVGADRLANASAAVCRYGKPVIVADFGTALTFDVVSAAGAYVGGVIVPGLPFMTDYLAEKTELLPRIALAGRCGAVGRSTGEAMRIGARVGYRGTVREITEYLIAGLKLKGVKLCATGGGARWALEGAGLPFAFDPDLTLHGLNKIFELNAV